MDIKLTFSVLLLVTVILFTETDCFTIQSGGVTLAENANLSYMITTDAAQGKVVRYTLETANPLFDLNSVTGELTNTAPFDFETTESYTLNIKAENTADVSDSATQSVVITITNIDEPPTFPHSIYRRVYLMNQPSETLLLTVTATDPEGSAITYSLTASHQALPVFFMITNSGEVKVTKDFTLMVPLFDSKVYTFNVKAVSTVHTALVEVEITMNSAKHLVHNTVLSGILIVFVFYGVN